MAPPTTEHDADRFLHERCRVAVPHRSIVFARSGSRPPASVQVMSAYSQAPLEPPRTMSRSQLLAEGMSERAITLAVRTRRLLRPRGGRYFSPDVDAELVEACRLGGRLSCVSEVARRGIFVLESETLHVHRSPSATPPPTSSRSVRHPWGRLHRPPHPRAAAVELYDALLQAVLCQSPRATIAMLDSALHCGALRVDDLDEFFAALPRRFRRLRPLLDARTESGPETLVRLMLRALGVPFEVQVEIPDVGRVDFLVAGWLIVECDSRAHHSDWEAQRRDRRRDQAAAALGLATFRPIAEDILWNPGVVAAGLAGLVRSRPVRNASRI